MYKLYVNGHKLPKVKKAKCFGTKKFRILIGELSYLETYIDLNEDKIEVYHLEPIKTKNED